METGESLKLDGIGIPSRRLNHSYMIMIAPCSEVFSQSTVKWKSCSAWILTYCVRKSLMELALAATMESVAIETHSHLLHKIYSDGWDSWAQLLQSLLSVEIYHWDRCETFDFSRVALQIHPNKVLSRHTHVFCCYILQISKFMFAATSYSLKQSMRHCSLREEAVRAAAV